MAKRDYRMRATGTYQTNFWQKIQLVFMALFLILAVQKIAKTKEDPQAAVASSGDMMVEIHWPDKVCVDVDLWLQSPGDERPVGYSNKSSKVFNLLRDDLGCAGDQTDLNYEIAFARGIPEGEYVVNIHLYNNYARLPEVPVKVIVSIKAKDRGIMEQVIVKDVMLRREGEEVTVARFMMKADGVIDTESINDLFKPLRSNPTLMIPDYNPHEHGGDYP